MTKLTARQNFDHAMNLYHSGDSRAAAEWCRKSLEATPDNVDLLTLQGVTLLDCKLAREALEPLQRAVALAPRFARARENYGQALILTGRIEEAVEQLRLAADLEPQSVPVRMKLAHALALAGEGDEADTVYEEAFILAPDRRKLAEAGEHLREGRLRECETICRELLRKNPDDVNALRLLARVAGEAERWGHAERLLIRALKRAPDFDDARLELARVYKQQDRLEDAVACTSETIGRNPNSASAMYLHASMLAISARHEDSLAAYRRTIELRPQHTGAWVGMGHLLKTLGRQEEGIAAYRTAIEQQPNFGEVYWSLANLKTFRFSESEIAEIEKRLAGESLSQDERVHFLFTLGKVREDQERYAEAFASYAEACELQRTNVFYDPVDTVVLHERICKVFTPGLFSALGSDHRVEPTPIFIVGLPRSGSTLIEQILASHSQVEGTAELPDVGRVITSLKGRTPGVAYPEAVQNLDTEELRKLGESYLERTRRHRSGLPYFTDKMPNNFSSIGLIHLMLPNARIIDARRHPLDSCFGSFKQHFAQVQL